MNDNEKHQRDALEAIIEADKDFKEGDYLATMQGLDVRDIRDKVFFDMLSAIIGKLNPTYDDVYCQSIQSLVFDSTFEYENNTE